MRKTDGRFVDWGSHDAQKPFDFMIYFLLARSCQPVRQLRALHSTVEKSDKILLGMTITTSVT